MAKQYPFRLDPFQSTSVACLVGVLVNINAPQPLSSALSEPALSYVLHLQERRESVLVAAHTSAGKTAVAE